MPNLLGDLGREVVYQTHVEHDLLYLLHLLAVPAYLLILYLHLDCIRDTHEITCFFL